MTTLRHHDDWGGVRFVTFSCFSRLGSLNQRGAKEIVIEELDRARSKHGFRIIGYVLMPEHVHLVLFPSEEMKLGLVIREIKSRSAKRYFSATEIAPSEGTSDLHEFWEEHRLYLSTILGDQVDAVIEILEVAFARFKTAELGDTYGRDETGLWKLAWKDLVEKLPVVKNDLTIAFRDALGASPDKEQEG